MKKTYLILIIVFLNLFNAQAKISEVKANQAYEQILTKEDSISKESSEPIIKTTVIEEEAEAAAPRNKWITVGLAVLGVVLVIVFRMLRKKKKQQNK